jgi:hypothetical protein
LWFVDSTFVGTRVKSDPGITLNEQPEPSYFALGTEHPLPWV